jgi:pimeloyl-ACP methyl ester carboxylesterase
MNIYKSADGERLVRERYAQFLNRWPVPSHHSYVHTREGETFVVVCGPENAPPLLLLHGSCANAAAFIFDVPVWAAHFRVYVIDMIGEPGFSAPSRPVLDSDAYALWLDDVMHGLGLDRAAIVGESLGGWLALDYAIRRPQRIARLALLCPGGVGRARNFLLKALPLLFLGKWGQRKVRDMALGSPPPDLPAAARQLLDFISLIFDHFKPRIVKLPVFSDEALKGLSMPVIAFVGGKDALLDSADTRRRLESNVPHADVRYFPEMGHVIENRTTPILEFLLARKDTSQ